MDPDAVAALLATDDGSADEDAPPGRVPHGSSDDPRLLDFSANVNPRVPDGVAGVYESALAAAASYPSDTYDAFRAAAADYVGCEPRQVVPTAGGLAAIRLTVGTTVRTGDDVLLPAPSFGEYAHEVRLQGATPEFVAPDSVVGADPDDYAMIVVCNPNNPTGEAVAHDDLLALAERCRTAETTLLVDEAFLGFTDRPSLAGTEDVVVARSLTKLFGLPGLRAGFAVATGDRRDRLDVARPAWGVSTPAAAVGTHCLQQDAFVERTRERVRSERARMAERLATDFGVFESAAPFLLIDAGTSDAVDDLLASARENDVALRDARTFRGLDSHVRVAVRLSAENDRLLEALGG
jgi:histidinol-phosphate aminotransferase/threonine-phosphate decarboxylase